MKRANLSFSLLLSFISSGFYVLLVAIPVPAAVCNWTSSLSGLALSPAAHHRLEQSFTVASLSPILCPYSPGPCPFIPCPVLLSLSLYPIPCPSVLVPLSSRSFCPYPFILLSLSFIPPSCLLPSSPCPSGYHLSVPHLLPFVLQMCAGLCTLRAQRWEPLEGLYLASTSHRLWVETNSLSLSPPWVQAGFGDMAGGGHLIELEVCPVWIQGRSHFSPPPSYLSTLCGGGRSLSM